MDIPERITAKHNFDKLTAIERAIDLKLDFRTFFEWYRDREAEEVLKIREIFRLQCMARYCKLML